MLEEESKKLVFVAMSGGVDSSVAALLLKREGHHVVGVFMRSYNLDGCAERDAEDARRVAEHIGIPFYVWNFEDEYKERVVSYMVNGYRDGLTPNPDVMCNKEIKFGLFFEQAITMGADYIATGHYVRRLKSTSQHPRHSLFAARDTKKDQSYFLWTLTHDIIERCLFPIGEYEKAEVRAIAHEAGLPTAEKKDSQGICFLGNITLKEFLKTRISEKHGVVLNAHGENIGSHEGAAYYTIGQRHGVFGGERHTDREKGDTKPFYVAEKDVQENTVTVVEGGSHPALYRKEVTVGSMQCEDMKSGVERAVLARVRYRQPLSAAMLKVSHENIGEEGGPRAILVFEKPQKFVAVGQSVVWYSQKGELLGGGVIVGERHKA